MRSSSLISPSRWRRVSSRRLALSGLLGVAALAAGAAPATADTYDKTLKYGCLWPVVEEPQPLDFRLQATDPFVIGDGSGQTYVHKGTLLAGGVGSEVLRSFGAYTVEGRVDLASTVTTGSGSTPWNYPLSVPQQNVASGDLLLAHMGSRQPIRVDAPPTITVDSIALTLIPRDEFGLPMPYLSTVLPTTPQTDDDPDTLQVACTLAPRTQDTRLVTGATPSPTPSPTPGDPTPIPVEPTPTPTEQTLPYSYALSGSSTLKTLTKGSLPLSGGIDATIGLPSGNFVGDLTLAPASGKLTALGFLPVDAKVNLLPTDKVTGSLVASKLTAVAKVRIKLPSVKTLGIELAGGANCQAKQISSITLTSTQPKFMPLSGGPIAGTFSISDLSGCGFLTGIVSPITSGSGNLIALNLTPKKA